MKKTSITIALVSFGLGLLIAGSIFMFVPDKDIQEAAVNEPVSSTLASPLYAAAPTSAVQAKPDQDFTGIAERLGPAVVSILAEKVEKRSAFGFDDPFDDFWNRFFDSPRQRDREQEYRARSQGTGFFISADGYILTNNHIVENAVKVTVTSLDGDEYTAEVVGTDAKTDLALLKVKTSGHAFASLGDSTRLKVGEWVLAIGNPLGMAHTVTAGIVSAKGRQLPGMNAPTYQDFIQTDASINRGNSGGPLVNMQAEVVGVTSMIYSPSGGSIGIGFAIPSNLAEKVIAQLKDQGKVVRGYLGITILPVNEDLRKLLKLESKQGAVINSVTEDSPAAKAELKTYDVVLKLGDQPIKDATDLMFKVADLKPGTRIDLTIIRDGKQIIVPVKIGTLDNEEEPAASESTENDIGISVTQLTSGLAERYGLQTQEGLLVTDVRRYSEAEDKGIRKGDIILEANQKAVKTVRQLQSALKDLKAGDPIMLLIRRENNRTFQDAIVVLRIPE